MNYGSFVKKKMKIFDCTTFFNENLMLEVRLNILNKYVDKFVVVEAKYSHSGEKKKLNFDIKKFNININIVFNALVVKLVDTKDLKSLPIWECQFESGRGHQII